MTDKTQGAAAPAATFSIADIVGQVATEETYPFEPMLPDGLTPSGVTFYLKSDLAPSVDGQIKDLLADMRRKEQMRAAQAAKSRPGQVTEDYDELDVAGRKLIATRIAGWTLKDEFTTANVLTVLKLWQGLGEQILAKSAELARFTPASSKA